MKKVLLLLFSLIWIASFGQTKIPASQIRLDTTTIKANAYNSISIDTTNTIATKWFAEQQGGVAGSTDTTSLSNRIDLKVNISDTASMLSYYLRKVDTTAMLIPYLRSNIAAATYSIIGHSHTLDSTTITGFHTTNYYNTQYYPLSSNPAGYLTSLSGAVLTSRSLTINGTSLDLSADRSWSVGTVTSIGTTSPITGGTITGTGTIAIDTSIVHSYNYNEARYQAKLISGTNIKTVNSTSLLGSGDVSVTVTECQPDAITFTSQTAAPFNTVTTSNAVILNGGDSCVWSFVVRGGGSPQLQINSESWSNSGLGRDGDTIKVRLTSANTSLTAVICTLYTNTASSTFSVTTDELEFLDVYGANAAAAYSLRRLRVNYAGSAIRVRRSNDNAESDIGFNAGHGLDTATLKTFVGSNSAYVTKWYDQTTNARDLVQATTGNQPRIVNAGTIERILGKPTIYGSGSNQSLKLTFTLNQPANFFSVWSLSSLGGFNVAFDGAAAETAMELKTTGGNHGEVYGGAYLTQTYPITAGTPLLTSILFNGSSSNAYKNGSSYVTGNAGSANPGGITLFNYNALGFGMNGFISEFIAYSADKTSGIADINTNINTYYSIY